MLNIDEMVGKIICGDCLEVMKDIPDKSIDLVLTDPPYGQTSCSWDKRVSTDILWNSIRRVLTENGIAILSAIHPYASELIQKNLKEFKYDLVWDKGNTTGFLDAKKKPLRRHELILVFAKQPLGKHCYLPIMRKGLMRKKGGYHKQRPAGNRVYNNQGNIPKINDFYYPTSILNFGTVYRNNYIHPTQKPVVLMEYLIKTYSTETDLILDPFAGSGSTLVACKQLGRRFIGIEISPEYCAIANKRLENTIYQPKMEGV